MQKNDLAATLVALNERAQATRDKEIRLNATLESTQAQLAALEDEMMKKYGTSDLATLRQMFEKARDEDSRAIQDFANTIEMRENLLNKVAQDLEGQRK
ncbi:hypothetical protein HNP46_000187 [Pseudomonas nitritireducens]|uniref:Uncharacterized protein n=1 Tax=Pseudomonas nitroreducens TaxID=46680 RepID=A0A7W7KFC0_PSENT|nr:hypothetical protein [Pseudomonas nitritireducens]MBB4861376.1 hypothetical protein [Pseudomonas nitritireducens]